MNWGVFGRGGLGLLTPHPPKEKTIYVQILYKQTPASAGAKREYPQHVLYPFTRKLEVTVSGGSTFARVKLKEIDGMAPQDVERAV